MECPMISISCVHCGQRMKITEEDGAKKAQCPKCGHIATIAGAKPGKRLRGSGSFDSGERTAALSSPVPEPTQITPPATDSDPGAETGSSPPLHEILTRSEEA